VTEGKRGYFIQLRAGKARIFSRNSIFHARKSLTRQLICHTHRRNFITADFSGDLEFVRYSANANARGRVYATNFTALSCRIRTLSRSYTRSYSQWCDPRSPSPFPLFLFLLLPPLPSVRWLPAWWNEYIRRRVDQLLEEYCITLDLREMPTALKTAVWNKISSLFDLLVFCSGPNLSVTRCPNPTKFSRETSASMVVKKLRR